MASKSINRFVRTMKERSFLFQQLVRRDFQQRYKRTTLGMLWSVLNPLLHLLVMMLVFSQLFGRNVNHYVIYLFSGNIVMSYYRESTSNGMTSLMGNARIISRINVPKYFFLLSNNVSALINFGLTIGIYFLFCLIDGIEFTPSMLMLWYPVLCLVVMDIGIGMVLSALFVFFRDVQYLYGIFLQLLQYLSVIFYTIDRFPAEVQGYFLLNPVYCNILYFRTAVLEGTVPSLGLHFLIALYAVLALGTGAYFYKKYNHRFVYYF